MKPWTVVLLTVLVLAGTGAFAWQTYNFSQHTPKLCTSCHLMQAAYDTWSHSAHKDIECHSCHRATIAEQNRYLVTMLIKRPKDVPARHGRVIVPRTICLECHWEGAPEIAKINASAGHAQHAFTQGIQCTVCHAQQVHRFMPDPTVCRKCHEETVKTRGMEKHDCQLCHRWTAEPAGSRSRGLVPTRETCLGCHQPREAELFPAQAPMRFECSTCHQPHRQPLPTAKDCLRCHQAVMRVGQHALHVTTAGLTCTSCHRPHSWKITEPQAKVDCARCHEYRPPASFVGPTSAAGLFPAHAVGGIP